MKVTFVRGPHLNPWELQSYLPVARLHDFIAIGADWQFYANPIELPEIHFKKGRVWGAALQRWGTRWPVLWNRLLSRMIGQSFGLYQFEKEIGKTDIVHTAEIYSTQTYQALRLKQRTGCRLAVTVWENLQGMGETHPLRRHRKKEIIQGVDGILAVTHTTRQMLIREGVDSERISVIYPGIDLRRFHPASRDPVLARQFGLEPDDFVILFIGRLVPEKGVAELLQAAQRILAQPQWRSVRFLFAGDGPMRGVVEKVSQAYPRGILMAGFIPYDAVPALHTVADLFVLPSKATPKWEEQFGYVLVESMACRKPLITTRSGSIPDVVGSAAILIEPGNATRLQEAIEQVLRSANERERLSNLARERALQVFSLEVIASQLMRFYDQIEKGLPVGER